MRKLVYLFELDSVRKYENQAKKGVLFTPGLKALFCEIVKNGNCVAITMNQLTDSQFVKEMISDDVAYACLLELFKKGALRASLYGDIRTASQYIQQALEKCLRNNGDSFIFSNLPVSGSDKVFLQEIKDALQFSDLSKIQIKLNNAVGEEKERLKIVYRFVYMILQLSICETSNIPQKEAKKKTFEEFLEEILKILKNHTFANSAFDEAIKQAVEIIERRADNISDGRCNRSNWLDTSASKGTSADLANEVIHICYNYTVEDSINGVSKHYDDNNFENTFKIDLVNRVSLYRNKTTEKLGAVSRFRWRRLARFAEYGAKNWPKGTYNMGLQTYETNYHKEKWQWRYFLFKKNIFALLVAIAYILIFCGVETVMSYIEDNFSIPIDNVVVSSFFSVFLFGVFGSIVSKILACCNRGKDFPDILESVIDIFVRFCDFCCIFGGTNDSYKLY